MRKFFFYAIRWQMSTLILAPVLFFMSTSNPWVSATVANFIGACIFFWIDKLIFRSGSPFSIWEIQEDVICCDCFKPSRGYRLVKAKGYDKTSDKKPKYRCERCSVKKSIKLKKAGIEV